MRIIFAGTPEFSVNCLNALADAGHNIVACYTQPDRKAGRGRKLTASPVKARALELGIPVEQPQSLKDTDAQATLSAYQADLMVVVAYGLLLPQVVLDAPKYGCINVHASVLPRWRGAAPIQRAVLAGDAESGVTIMQMDIGLDTGDMLKVVTTPIAANESGGSLHDKLSTIGAKALIETIATLEANGSVSGPSQDDSLANYAHKLDKAEAVINWQQSSQMVDQQIRAFNPWPVAETTFGDKRVRIWAAQLSPESGAAGQILSADKNGIVVACQSGSLTLTKIQNVGGKPMSCADFLNGYNGGAKALLGITLGQP